MVNQKQISMLRQRENPDAFRAGVLSVAVHVLLLGALLISFNWKNTHPVSIAQVELWDSIPSITSKPVPEKIVEPKPVEREVPKPRPVIAPEPVPKPQVDIVIKKKPVKEKPVKKEPPKPEPKPDALAKLQEAARQEALTKPSNDALRQLQQDIDAEKAEGEQKNLAAKASANAGIVDQYKSKIQEKIRGNVNKTLCGDGNPELRYEIALMPTGDLSSPPRLVKPSGIAACDDAVERAIIISAPLPLPRDAALFSQFRNLTLTFRPNEN